ncbi:hypothetical protein LAZ67_10001149 [Cordylochernes scorpioides]|uniref:Transposase n=1 Tax=Cordylochernes scorpioides TaxID=51811 RepID=A0ABY6KYZ7_9ARAC|nr:hypothetical protein LAZ67_10001149 [Cordylochernes scorpioides]
MMPQPPYSPDLAPCDFFLFPNLKRPMKGRRYATLDEIKTASKEELKKIFKNDFLKCFEDWKNRWHKKRADKIVVVNLPNAIRDESIVVTLRPYCRVVSLTHAVVGSGGYTWITGNRKAFILLNEGLKLHQLPVKLVIVSKSESTPAYITYGLRCRCHRHISGPGVENSLLQAHAFQQLLPIYTSCGIVCAYQVDPLNSLQHCRDFAQGEYPCPSPGDSNS